MNYLQSVTNFSFLTIKTLLLLSSMNILYGKFNYLKYCALYNSLEIIYGNEELEVDDLESTVNEFLQISYSSYTLPFLLNGQNVQINNKIKIIEKIENFIRTAAPETNML